MSTVLLIIQLIISIILTGLILIHRSEGGALGIGGGAGGGLMLGCSSTTSIARVTAILGAVFIVNCLALSVVYEIENRDNLIIDEVIAEDVVMDTETVIEPLTVPAESDETSVPLAGETPAEDAGPEEDE